MISLSRLTNIHCEHKFTKKTAKSRSNDYLSEKIVINPKSMIFLNTFLKSNTVLLSTNGWDMQKADKEDSCNTTRLTWLIFLH